MNTTYRFRNATLCDTYYITVNGNEALVEFYKGDYTLEPQVKTHADATALLNHMRSRADFVEFEVRQYVPRR